MFPTSALVLFVLFTAATSLHAPGCLPDEDATIVSQAMFPAPDPNTGLETLTNLTLTFYTCPSRQAQTQPGQSETPIDICGIMDSSAVFSSTITCLQAPGNLPTVRDCNNIDTAVIDSFSRPMIVTIPPLSGLAVSLPNNTCAFVFLNDDANDTYDTCLHTIPDMGQDIMEECPPAQDGFIGTIRSPIQPGVQNWEVRMEFSGRVFLRKKANVRITKYRIVVLNIPLSPSLHRRMEGVSKTPGPLPAFLGVYTVFQFYGPQVQRSMTGTPGIGLD
ncbi:hypothetical protein GGX14DRAFT_406350 [Mycena pura]|uniref:Uncharacterized protein n=1 Tax=Mycena pura TaxID=153505 RepID=A0AAD6UXC9_9AGAR|nr:hypothetical protein GGX14DRAFT_406350 [Mycena pura]